MNTNGEQDRLERFLRTTINIALAVFGLSVITLAMIVMFLFVKNVLL